MGEGVGTGGTGYAAAAPLIASLARRGHAVRAPVRPGSEGKLPAGVEARVCDPFAAPPGIRAAGRSLAETPE